MSQLDRSGGTRWQTVPRWHVLTAEQLDDCPIGSRRSLAVTEDLSLALIRADVGWTLNTRRGIRSVALAGLWTAPRVPVIAARWAGTL